MCGIPCGTFIHMKMGLCRTRPMKNGRVGSWSSPVKPPFVMTREELLFNVPYSTWCDCVCMQVWCVNYMSLRVSSCLLLCPCAACICMDLCVYVHAVGICVVYTCVCCMSLCVCSYVCMGVVWCRWGYVCLCVCVSGHVCASVFGCVDMFVCVHGMCVMCVIMCWCVNVCVCMCVSSAWRSSLASHGHFTLNTSTLDSSKVSSESATSLFSLWGERCV